MQSDLMCPACGGTLHISPDAMTCDACGAATAKSGGVYDFVRGAAETNLDVEAYDAETPPSRFANIFGEFEEVIAEIFPAGPIPVTVEIGSGSGVWSTGLDIGDRYKTVYCTDISATFLRRLSERLSNPRTHIICQSGEALAFAPGSVDLVAGRSVLHHIYDYLGTLERVHTWLRPGGAAVFFEPNIQGKVWVAFFLDLVRRIDTHFDLGKTNPDQRNAMERVSRHMMKDFMLPNIEEIRPNIEDKYIFNVDTLTQQCADIGYSSVRFVQPNFSPDILALRLRQAVNIISGDPKAAETFAPIFEAFARTFALIDPPMVSSPMGYFVLTK